MREACQSKCGISLVCELEDEIVGYCLMWTSLDEGNITNVAVDERYRNKGDGRALMKTLETYGLERGIRNFYLEVRKSNESAVRMYQNAGYKPVGIRKNFYEKPAEDAIIMAKIFKE
jgi:ribosomal-protein-alanine N-acetyltransferase